MPEMRDRPTGIPPDVAVVDTVAGQAPDADGRPPADIRDGHDQVAEELAAVTLPARAIENIGRPPAAKQG